MKKRRICQGFATFISNSYLKGILLGGIYQGKFKYFCIPTLNCWSCPLSIFSCPIGAIQHIVAYGTYYIPLYSLGVLGIVASIGGRITCGWICPFGLLQDMLYKVKIRKFKISQGLTYIKYFVLVILVFLIPSFTKEPWFSKLCPAGTIEAGIPLLLLEPELRRFIGELFSIKIGILILFMGWMLISKRPFCRIACPLGAIYSLFNHISLFKLKIDEKKCTHCNKCYESCPMGIKVYQELNSKDCIRCLECSGCPQGVVKFSSWPTCV